MAILPKILHVLGKFVRIDNWSLYVWSHHKDSLGLVDGRQRLIMLVSKNDMTNGIEFNSSASSKMEKNFDTPEHLARPAHFSNFPSSIS